MQGRTAAASPTDETFRSIVREDGRAQPHPLKSSGQFITASAAVTSPWVGLVAQ
jgi:hypothetical protein